MSAARRARGKLVRRVLRLDRAWRAEGKAEGRTANDLAWRLGQAYRAGLGPAAERARRRAA
jgi:hypothetical protein